MAQIIVQDMKAIDITSDVAESLALDHDDVEYILDEGQLIGDCYEFTASGTANTGTAYIDPEYVALLWGGDPQWFIAPRNEETDHSALTLALNGELEAE